MELQKGTNPFTGEQTVVEDTNSAGRRAGCLVAFAILVFALAAGAALLAGLAAVLTWVALGLGVLGVALAIVAVRKALVARRWRPAQLVVQPWPLPLGATTTVRFEKPGRSAGPAEVEVTATLLCKESVSYRTGSGDPVDATETVIEQPCPVRLHPDGEGLVADIDLTIEPLSPPTMVAGFNSIMWYLQVHLDIAGSVDHTSLFVLLVASSLDPSR